MKSTNKRSHSNDRKETPPKTDANDTIIVHFTCEDFEYEFKVEAKYKLSIIFI
jgi:hypothetical protein